MVCANRKLLLIAVLIFVISQPINGTISGNGLCSAKFDSEYEDACLRGYRMKEEAEKHSFEGLNGVTCENSCSDIYKNDANLVNACKYGCDIKLSLVVGDGVGGMWDHLRIKMMIHLQILQNLFGYQHELKFTPDNTEDQNQKSEIKTTDPVRFIRIFFGLGRTEHATVQDSAQTLVRNESPFDKIRQLLGFAPPSYPHANDQTVDGNNQQVPHHSLGYPSGTLDSDTIMGEDNKGSFVDKFFTLVRRVNPITCVLIMLLVFTAIFSLIVMSIYVYRRCTRRTNLYSLLADDIEIKSDYHVGLEEKTNGEGKVADSKDAKEALDV